MEIAGYDPGKNAYNYLRWFFLWVKNQLILNAFVLACLESVSTLEFVEKLEREGKRGINRRLEGKGKALPLLLCPSCSFISFMTLLFPFLLAFSPAETLATQHTGRDSNPPDLIGSLPIWCLASRSPDFYQILPIYYKILKTRKKLLIFRIFGDLSLWNTHIILTFFAKSIMVCYNSGRNDVKIQEMELERT